VVASLRSYTYRKALLIIKFFRKLICHYRKRSKQYTYLYILLTGAFKDFHEMKIIKFPALSCGPRWIVDPVLRVLHSGPWRRLWAGTCRLKCIYIKLVMVAQIYSKLKKSYILVKIDQYVLQVHQCGLTQLFSAKSIKRMRNFDLSNLYGHDSCLATSPELHSSVR
jgi:hypothetical protein